MKIVWSELAESQLKDIYFYYKNIESKKLANKIISKIIKSTEILKSNQVRSCSEITCTKLITN
jgi:plasmid stabilization system protein ParE